MMYWIKGVLCFAVWVVIFLSYASIVSAQDLGVEGSVWPIEEISLKRVIIDQAAHTDWNSVGQKLAYQATHFDKQLPANALPKAQDNHTRYVDPSVVLNRDIFFNEKILYLRGTLINPLKIFRPQSDFLFFDGTDREERDFALNALKQMNGTKCVKCVKDTKEIKKPLMLVMTKGDPVHWAKVWKYPVYFAYPDLLTRFSIRVVPSLLGVSQGIHQTELAITEFREPYCVQDIVRCWNGCLFSKKLTSGELSHE